MFAKILRINSLHLFGWDLNRDTRCFFFFFFIIFSFPFGLWENEHTFCSLVVWLTALAVILCIHMILAAAAAAAQLSSIADMVRCVELQCCELPCPSYSCIHTTYEYGMRARACMCLHVHCMYLSCVFQCVCALSHICDNMLQSHAFTIVGSHSHACPKPSGPPACPLILSVRSCSLPPSHTYIGMFVCTYLHTATA